MKMAAIASYSAQGGFSVNISTTVQPRLLEERTLSPVSQPTSCEERRYLSQGTMKGKQTKLRVLTETGKENRQTPRELD